MEVSGVENQTNPYNSWRLRVGVALTEIDQYFTESEPANGMIGTFARAVQCKLSTDFIDEVFEKMHTRNSALDPHYAINKFLRGMQADLLQHNPLYSQGFEELQPWFEAFDEISLDHSRKQTLLYNVTERDIQSNVANRYKAVKFIAALMADRWEGEPSHLDVGCSRLHGSKKLVYESDSHNNILPFSPIDILDTDNNEHFMENIHMSALVNLALSQHVEFGTVNGIDITNIDNPLIKHWAKACSLKPNELLLPNKKAEYELLDGLDPKHQRIGFFRGDFSSNTEVKAFRDWSSTRDYDIITFSTVFYLGSKAARRNMLVNAANVLSENGIILILDAPDGNFEKPYNYYLSAIDGQNIENGEQTILRFNNGRCEKAMLESGTLLFPGGEQTIEEVLLTQ